MADSNYASVALLLRCNGTDGSTTFTDEGPLVHTVTANGNAQLDTAEKKYGTASALFDGAGDSLTVPSHASFNFGTSDFTVEFWVCPSDLTAFCAWTSRTASSGATPWAFYWDGDATLTVTIADGSDNEIGGNSSSAITTENVWYHIALTRSGTAIRLYVDGVHQSAVTTSASIKTSTTALTIADDAGGSYFPGWIDDYRITTGVARYTGTGSFTPPTELELGSTGVDAYVAEDTGPLSTTIEVLMTNVEAKLQNVSPLSSTIAMLMSNVEARVEVESPLGSPAFALFSDFTASLLPDALQKHVYLLDLTTPGGVVRVPMSSWQSTLQTTSNCFGSAVVPNCLPYLTELGDATEFAISRVAETTLGELIEVELVRVPLQNLQIDQGPTASTASISGYSSPYLAVDPPDSVYDRTLTDIRSISTYASGARVRCGIDWALRPGSRAYYAETSMIVAYMNYYVTQDSRSIQAYMDVGERNA